MAAGPEENVVIHFTCTDGALREEEREEVICQLYRELEDADGALGDVSRVEEEPPPGAKSTLAEVTALLSVVVGAAGLRPLFDYLIARHAGREFSVEIVVAGRKVVLTARTEAEMRMAYQAAVNLLSGGR